MKSRIYYDSIPSNATRWRYGYYLSLKFKGLKCFAFEINFDPPSVEKKLVFLFSLTIPFIGWVYLKKYSK